MNDKKDKPLIQYASSGNRRVLAQKCAAGALTRLTRGVYADAVRYEALEPRARYIELIKICSHLHPGYVVAGRSAAVVHGIDILSYPEYPAKADVIIADWNKRSASDIMHQYSGETNNTFSQGSKREQDGSRSGPAGNRSGQGGSGSKLTGYESDSAGYKPAPAGRKSGSARKKSDLSELAHIRIQSPAESLFFIMRNNSEAEAIVALHSALKQCSHRAAFAIKKSKHFAFPLYSQEAFDLCTELQNLIQKNEGVNGIQKAKRILYLATDGAESPGESLTILYCHRFGLELPIINPTLLDTEGRFLGRVDLLWNCGGARIERRIRTDIMNGRYCRVLSGHVKPGDTVIVEFDGKIKYIDDEMRSGRSVEDILLREKDRELDIRRFGHEVIRISWDEFYYPETLYKKLTAGGVPARRYVRKNFEKLI